jgi:hypothetical protein
MITLLFEQWIIFKNLVFILSSIYNSFAGGIIVQVIIKTAQLIINCIKKNKKKRAKTKTKINKKYIIDDNKTPG